MRLAKLYIKGMKDPVDLSEEHGKKADEIIKREGIYSSLGDDDVVSLGSFWTGSVSDMRHVYWIDTDPKRQEGVRYSHEQLQSFERALQPFFIKKGDEDYVRMFERYVKYVAEDDYQHEFSKREPFATPFTTARLEAIRSQYDSQEEKKSEIEKMMKERIEGTLSVNGEYRFYQHMKTMVLGEHGEPVITDANLYTELTDKVSQYKSWVGRKQYAEDQQALDYAQYE